VVIVAGRIYWYWKGISNNIMPPLEYKTIIKLGGKNGSFVVALPKNWCRYYRLKPGDKVTVMTNSEEVRIIPLESKFEHPTFEEKERHI